MSTRLQIPMAAKWFLLPWSLVSAWACLTWFLRIYDHGFRYNRYILQFEFGWSRVLLLVFGVAGVVFYQRSRAAMPGWAGAAEARMRGAGPWAAALLAGVTPEGLGGVRPRWSPPAHWAFLTSAVGSAAGVGQSAA
jgi:hypothetical protein